MNTKAEEIWSEIGIKNMNPFMLMFLKAWNFIKPFKIGKDINLNEIYCVRYKHLFRTTYVIDSWVEKR